MTSQRKQRRIKLIQPRLQMRMVGCFVGLGALALLAQTLVLGAQLGDMANRLPSGGGYLAHEIPGMLTNSLLLSLALLLPSLLLIGVRITFRIAGPLYRMEQYLRDVPRGKWSEPCSIRKDDHLQEFCVLLNEALECARAQGEAEGRAAAQDHETSAA